MEILLLRLASGQPHAHAGCKKNIAINLKKVAINLKYFLEPHMEFSLLRLASGQPHAHAGCKKKNSH